MGLMIAAYPTPEQAARLAIRGGEAREKLHMTLVYLSPEVEPNLLAKAIMAANKFSQRRREYDGEPWEGRVSGFGRFSNPEEDVLYAGVDLFRLEEYRSSLLDELYNEYAILADSDHGFTPHITLKYLNETDGIPFERIGPIDLTFNSVCVVTDDFKYEFPLVRNDSVTYNITLEY